MMLKDTKVLLPLIITASCFVIAMADSWDPADDTGAGATVLTVTEDLQIHGSHTTSNSVDDADWFRFYLEAGTRYQFESVGTSDTYAYLYFDSLGNTKVAFQDYQSGDAGGGANFKILYTPSVSEDYFLRVVEDQSGGSTAYSLHYFSESTFDDWDSNDDSSTNATLLSINSSLQTTEPHKLGPLDSYDWFKFNLAEGVEYTFESIGAWDSVGTLFDETLESIVSDDQNGNDLNFKIIYTPTNSGTFCFRVESWDLGLDINYSLQYSLSDANDSDGDLLPDWWELQYFKDLTVEPDDYGDLDIFSNLDEYIAGTDPTNGSSFFFVTNFSSSVDHFILEWVAVESREYQVFWADSLTNGFLPLEPVAIFPQNSFTDSVHSSDNASFYKVKVRIK